MTDQCLPQKKKKKMGMIPSKWASSKWVSSKWAYTSATMIWGFNARTIRRVPLRSQFVDFKFRSNMICALTSIPVDDVAYLVNAKTFVRMCTNFWLVRTFVDDWKKKNMLRDYIKIVFAFYGKVWRNRGNHDTAGAYLQHFIMFLSNHLS